MYEQHREDAENAETVYEFGEFSLIFGLSERQDEGNRERAKGDHRGYKQREKRDFKRLFQVLPPFPGKMDEICIHIIISHSSADCNRFV